MNHAPTSKLSYFILILFLAACQNTESTPHLTCDKNDISTPFLLTVQEAKNKIEQNASVIVVEVSRKQEYKKGHLPKAANIWRSDFQINQADGTRGLRCSADTLQSVLQRLGITEKSYLILYDAKGSCDALRLAWVLDYYGFANYAIMNGGKKAWTDQGLALSFEDYKPTENPDYTFKSNANTSVLASTAEVRSAIDDPNTIIVDTREDYEYKGSCFVSKGELYPFKKGAFSRGCISTAVHLNWSDLSDLATDHRVKCKKDLVYDLNQKGITKDKNVIVYCHSGARSSHTYFVLKKVLGFQNVKNYDGSWIAWSHLASTDAAAYPIDLIVSEEDFSKELENMKIELQQKTLTTK